MRGFLSRRVIAICIASLLSRFLSNYTYDKETREGGNKTSENHLEALIVLLDHVGQHIEEREKRTEEKLLPGQDGMKSGIESVLYKQCELAIATKQSNLRLQENFKIIDVIVT